MDGQIALRPEPPDPGLPRRIPGMIDPRTLTRRQKAAIVVRLLLAEGATLPLSELPEPLQAELTTQMTQMRFVDRATLRDVVEEFASELDSIGLSFPGGLEGALGILEGAISPEIAARLRKQSGAIWTDDPWETIAEFPPEKIMPLLQRESPEIGAVILSKLKVAKAADLLSKLPGALARRLTLAVSETADIAPSTVRRIGVALAAELKAEPPRAFPAAAVERLGAILNVSTSVTREEVLEGLDAEDAELGSQVRKAIFTFENIPDRVAARDVPVVVKGVDQDILILAIAGATEKTQATVDYLLANMSQRLADTMRDEAGELGKIAPAEVERAETAVVSAIREAVDAGEIKLIAEDEE
ncbi:flagellar motor switch protein FliG [Palleronia salina]|uniref:Flagellar motor switch protein FliG n=2 Tax=Palleronia TaxID=315422 RepID=A0A1M6L5L2_9RHOB|nr:MULTISPECIES: FliG C-terminal domain-containing protein [Palleronia]SEN68644.1 flagellar motor switch protein FliG [Palleronia pelagia]SHJ66503.1 flagellar motor switch protein FliG [Palleronia salina]